ncbi:class I glutamine amidotransferase-like protein [Ramicandelaber brevisporus]|nr:class I glutamine amidotransferase-like protein [Ramicandelaber brevisporus]
MARAFGGKVSRNELGWEVGYSVIDLTPSGVELLVSGGSAMSQSKTSIHINQMHRDIITDIPAGFEVIGSNDNCAAQILVSSDRTIMSMQGHPEYYPAIVRDIVEVRNKSGIFTDEFAQDVYAKLANGHDGDDIGSMILRFFAAGKV